jgi:transcriptional regulator with XRE-family HTH domain
MAIECNFSRNHNMTIKITPHQCKMARTALGLGVRELAEKAKLSPDTAARFERGDALKERTIDDLQRALETAGVEFIPQNGGGPGARLKKPQTPQDP